MTIFHVLKYPCNNKALAGSHFGLPEPIYNIFRTKLKESWAEHIINLRDDQRGTENESRDWNRTLHRIYKQVLIEYDGDEV